MVITYHGGECFKVAFGNTTLAFNPIAKNSKTLGNARFGADIAFVTTKHPDFSGVESVTHGDKEPFVIDGAGEYEVSGVFARGVAASSKYGGEERINTIYRVTLEQMNILFLGALDTTDLPQEAWDLVESVDVLFVPIGGDGVLDATKAHKLAVDIAPSVVVPMHYPTDAGSIGAKDALQTFLKESGAEKTEQTSKLTIKRKDLEGKTGEVAVLSV